MEKIIRRILPTATTLLLWIVAGFIGVITDTDIWVVITAIAVVQCATVLSYIAVFGIEIDEK